jgi:hypothetical protein
MQVLTIPDENTAIIQNVSFLIMKHYWRSILNQEDGIYKPEYRMIPNKRTGITINSKFVK